MIRDERVEATLDAMRLSSEKFLPRKDEIGAFGQTQFYKEDAAFADWVKEFDPTTILELGTGPGHFSSIIARGMHPQAEMMTIDIGAGDAQRLVPQLTPEPMTQEIWALVADSREDRTLEAVREWMDDIGTSSLDLVFIDTDHTFPTTRREVELYRPLLASGGALCFHDIQSTIGVRGVWLDLRESGALAYFEFIEHEQSHGIGALIIE